jgi:hypothetical protein
MQDTIAKLIHYPKCRSGFTPDIRLREGYGGHVNPNLQLLNIRQDSPSDT